MKRSSEAKNYVVFRMCSVHVIGIPSDVNCFFYCCRHTVSFPLHQLRDRAKRGAGQEKTSTNNCHHSSQVSIQYQVGNLNWLNVFCLVKIWGRLSRRFVTTPTSWYCSDIRNKRLVVDTSSSLRCSEQQAMCDLVLLITLALGGHSIFVLKNLMAYYI